MLQLSKSTESLSSKYAPSEPSIFLPMQKFDFGYASSIRSASLKSRSEYAPSVAPSERSNVGLPSRYRAVTRNVGQTNQEVNQEVNGEVNGENEQVKDSMDDIQDTWSTPDTPPESESDDEEFWAAKKVARDRRRGVWMGGQDLEYLAREVI